MRLPPPAHGTDSCRRAVLTVDRAVHPPRSTPLWPACGQPITPHVLARTHGSWICTLSGGASIHPIHPPGDRLAPCGYVGSPAGRLRRR